MHFCSVTSYIHSTMSYNIQALGRDLSLQAVSLVLTLIATVVNIVLNGSADRALSVRVEIKVRLKQGVAKTANSHQ